MYSVGEYKNRKVIMKSTVKIEKASTCFTRLYGRAAYEAWKAREAEIDDLARRNVCRTAEIAALREANFRLMKLGRAGLAAGRFAAVATAAAA